jgi:hypothetical protein
MTRDEWLAAVRDLLARRYGISITDTNLTETGWAAGDSPEQVVEAYGVKFRLKPLPEDGSQDRPASDGGSEDGEAARSDLNNKTSFPKGMPRD